MHFTLNLELSLIKIRKKKKKKERERGNFKTFISKAKKDITKRCKEVEKDIKFVILEG